jgi:hypothetical protein
VTLPKPVPGLVIRYAYLWHDEFLEGREEGSKDRPCALVVATTSQDGQITATVLPITHSEPRAPSLALEIPATVRKRLGLDGARSWVVFSELNRFAWPGPDLRRLPDGDNSTIAYGMLPPGFLAELQKRFYAAYKAQRLKVVRRSE